MKQVIFVFLAVSAPMAFGAPKYRHMAYLHHSTGGCLWYRSWFSDLTPPTTIPEEIHKYNVRKGFAGSDTVKGVESWVPSNGNNNWSRWNDIFTNGDSVSLTSEILTDTIVNIKTCYQEQTTLLTDDSVTAHKTYIRNIVGVMAQHPDHFFILWDNYPCSVGWGSTADPALRSLKFCRWMKDTLANGLDAYGPFPHNIYLFDVFRIIADSSTGHSDSGYGSWAEGPGDNHPSNAAVAAIDSLFVTQAFDAAIAYEQDPMPVTWAGPPTLTLNTKNQVQVKWETLSEINTYRFYVIRSGKTIGSVNAGGTSLAPRPYAVIDSNVAAGTWTYKIMEEDLDGSIHYSQTVSTTVPTITPVPIVTAYALEQNYPNPFNPNTTIQYELPNASEVRLTVFNVLGQEAVTLVNETKPAGIHTVQLDGSRLASGLYFYRLQAGQYVEMKKLVLLK
jgi:hypothetical protein